MPISDTILRSIVLASQKTPFRARGSYSNIDLAKQKDATDVDKAKAEALDKERFFSFFPGHDVKAAIRDACVLDFGSGYGGRTVEYARMGAAEVYGVEPFPRLINSGYALASEWGVRNVHFDVCGDFSIPYEDAQFDVAITFDVLEHVADPRRSLAELHRVLKPSGVLYAVFPLYRGMFSHHLDYLTLFPGLHLIFKPERIMKVVNELLDTRFQDIEVLRHRQLQKSYIGDRYILPMLNGMGLDDFKINAKMFEISNLDQVSVAEHFVGRNSITAKLITPLMRMPPVISEIFTFHICAIMHPRK